MPRQTFQMPRKDDDTAFLAFPHSVNLPSTNFPAAAFPIECSLNPLKVINCLPLSQHAMSGLTNHGRCIANMWNPHFSLMKTPHTPHLTTDPR